MHGDLECIAGFLACVSDLVTAQVKAALRSDGFDFREEGQGLGKTLIIQSKAGDVTFCLRNLLLEIATVDRDEEPPRFDYRVLEPEFFVRKSCCLIESKLKILFCLLKQEDLETAVKLIEANAEGYERIRIVRIDQNSQQNDGLPARN